MLAGMAHGRAAARIGAVALLVGALLSSTTYGQERRLEEIVVNFEVRKLVDRDIFVWFDGQTIFVPVIGVFDLLDLNITADLPNRQLSGFLFSRDNKYRIDLQKNVAKLRGKEYSLTAADYYLTPIDLFLRVDLFEALFGLKLEFSFSALRVYTKLDKEFPLYKKLQRKQAHQRLREGEEVLKGVKTLPYLREYFKGGVVDWTLASNPLSSGQQYFGLTMGGMLLGGDLTVSGTGDTRTGLETDQVTYRWHYYFDKNRYLTQAELGHVQTSGALSRGLVGGLLTNRPQVERKYFQTINIYGNIGEGWEVELYVDQKLIDFVYTDKSGAYEFDIDIYYGASTIELKMYGPNGELRTEERTVRVPYNLIPKNTFEYAVAAGESAVRRERKRYAQANAYYGATNGVTVGGSVDLPLGDGSDDTTGSAIYAGEATVQLAGNLTTSGFFSPGYAANFALNYSKPTLFNVNGTFTKYFDNPHRNVAGQDFSVRLSTSAPVRLGGRYLGLRCALSWDRFPFYQVINMNYGFTAPLYALHLNYLGKYKVTRYANRRSWSLTSQLIASTYLIRWVRPQFRVVYDHETNKLTRYSLHLSKRVFRTGQISFSYQRDQRSRTNTFAVTFNLYSSFATLATRVLHTGQQTSMTQTQRGSIRYDQNAHRLRFERRSGVGFGSAVVRPFLDRNYNGRFDSNEEELSGLRARVKGGRARSVGGGRFYYYDGLRAYDEYLVKIDQSTLDDPLLKPTHENYRVAVNPNVVTTVDVPVVKSAEISGIVERQGPVGVAGVGGIRIRVVNLSSDVVTEIITFSNGEFYYLGLLPGLYSAHIAPEQLERLGYGSRPETIQFDVKPLEEGTSIDDINFLLIPTP